ncbi:YsnF/AvaK domain-containing protein [Caballeronia glathei]|uniref:YsnF/AvaK domain-containing protein n=1 Tax=Caballeronia glathei TaxID=60547 RepID=UPI002D7E69DC|nr:YsnF/AvaK domain-containing protein [Caballeronia glathei]
MRFRPTGCSPDGGLLRLEIAMSADDNPENAHAPADPPDEVLLSAIEEKLTVGVRTTETGSVRVRKFVHEEMQPVRIRLRSEHVEVRRVPINRPVEARTQTRREGNTLVVPVFEYVPVVKMQLTLKEEVHITTTEIVEDVEHQVLTNSEELVVERREGASGEWKPEPSAD